MLIDGRFSSLEPELAPAFKGHVPFMGCGVFPSEENACCGEHPASCGSASGGTSLQSLAMPGSCCSLSEVCVNWHLLPKFLTHFPGALLQPLLLWASSIYEMNPNKLRRTMVLMITWDPSQETKHRNRSQEDKSWA